MKVEWLGHASMLVENDGVSVVFDPYQRGSVPGLKDISEEADFVFVSHSHYDHDGIDCVKLNAKSSSDIDVHIIDTFHDDKGGALRGPNKIHIIIFENGLKAVHMGDIGCELTDGQYELLADTDVLFMPIGGFFTVAPKLAADIVKRINPSVVIPMHFRSDENPKFGYDAISTKEEFLSYFDSDYSIKTLNDSKFDYNKADALSKQIIVLKPKN
ncbi:MAG: MBL fold metallo-hydrolase, partial [Clostridia bacterium]|nr:MBL fold metallo-hydrolase [Clostridia bacterium]